LQDPNQVSQELSIWTKKPTTTDGTPEPASEIQFADYALLDKFDQPIAIIEAKKTARDARVGMEQAKQYAEAIQKNTGREQPFIFFSNGFDIFYWDTHHYPPHKVYGFPTRGDLERMMFLRRNEKPLSQELINKDISNRPYQIEAIRSVFENLEHGKRKSLLVMATGTGKTRTCVSMIDVLMRTNRVQKVLFLVDRIALRDQALDAFKEFLPHAPAWPNKDEYEFVANRRVYCATYQTMYNLIQSSPCPVSPFFFDMIVADESHRSIYNVYKNVLTYLEGIQLGLTATPKDAIEHNTFTMFDCSDGIPTFAYTFEEAIHNHPPYLSDYQVLTIQTKFQKEGIRKETMTLEDQMKLLREGREPADIDYEGSEIEKKVTNRGTNALIVREFMEECLKDDSGTLPGKTIFFAMTMKHARRIEEEFNNLYPEHKGEIAKVIVSDDPRVYGKGGLLDQFKNEDLPRIAISVDMLDTGIDVREILNLVFAKPVFSYTKFWQMIGRGTRLLEPNKIKPWCTHKENFLIIDCWQNFEYFEMNPAGKIEAPTRPIPVRLFEAKLQKLAAAQTCHRDDIVATMTEELKKDITKLPPRDVVVMDAASQLDKLDEMFWQKLTDGKKIFLGREIAPLMRTRSGEDFKAMSFEIKVIQYSTAKLAQTNEQDSKIETMEEALKEMISDLPLTVNIVEKEKELIHEVLNNNYLGKADEEALTHLTQKLAPLMQYRDEVFSPDQDALDLQDITREKQYIVFGAKHESLTIQKYKEKVEALINKLATENEILQKIKQGETISSEEMEKLANTLADYEPYPTEENLQKAYDARNVRFIDLIKYILGLSSLVTFSERVTEAFADFIASHNTFSLTQIRFLKVVRDYIIANGTITRKNLVNAPFTQIHSNGILGVFTPLMREEIWVLSNQMTSQVNYA